MVEACSTEGTPHNLAQRRTHIPLFCFPSGRWQVLSPAQPASPLEIQALLSVPTVAPAVGKLRAQKDTLAPWKDRPVGAGKRKRLFSNSTTYSTFISWDSCINSSFPQQLRLLGYYEI